MSLFRLKVALLYFQLLCWGTELRAHGGPGLHWVVLHSTIGILLHFTAEEAEAQSLSHSWPSSPDREWWSWDLNQVFRLQSPCSELLSKYLLQGYLHVAKPSAFHTRLLGWGRCEAWWMQPWDFQKWQQLDFAALLHEQGVMEQARLSGCGASGQTVEAQIPALCPWAVGFKTVLISTRLIPHRVEVWWFSRLYTLCLILKVHMLKMGSWSQSTNTHKITEDCGDGKPDAAWPFPAPLF